MTFLLPNTDAHSLDGNTTMNLFIDTNVFLSFYEYSSEDLNKLEELAVYIKNENVRLHLPEQTKNEFVRGRDRTVNRVMNDLKKTKFMSRFPRLCMDYDEYDSLRKYLHKCRKKYELLMEALERDVSDRNLKADNLISYVFALSTPTTTTDNIIAAARIRTDLGNPPGKPRSVGDAVIWETLLDSVPPQEEFCLISYDKDFQSSYNPNVLHPFLESEWAEKKGVKPRLFTTLVQASKFLDIRILSTQFQAKEDAIRRFTYSGSFRDTHQNIRDLKDLDGNFTQRQFNRLLMAFPRNNQIGWILMDNDVAQFFWKLTEGRLGEIYGETLEVLQPWLRESIDWLEYEDVPDYMMERFQELLDLDPCQAPSEGDEDIPL